MDGHWALVLSEVEVLGMGHWGSGIQMKNYGICSNPKHIWECFPNPRRCTEFRLRSTTSFDCAQLPLVVGAASRREVSPVLNPPCPIPNPQSPMPSIFVFLGRVVS
jgi:hypothetical protein